MPPLEVPELSGANPQLQRAMAKIVQVEQKALNKVDEKVATVDNKLKLVKEIKTKFTEVRDAFKPFKSVKDFRDLKGVSSNPDIVSASSIDKDKAEPGTYTFEVMSLANPASLMTSGMPDRDKSQIGVGYISFTLPSGETKDVYINSDNNTLDGVARAINGSNMGVKAQVVNDGTDADEPWRIVISGEKSGWKNGMDWAEFNFLDGDIDIDRDRTTEAKSATIKFNGQPMYVDENSIKDLLPGVVVDLNKAVPGQTVKLEIKPDMEKIGDKAKNMVDKLNAVLQFIQHQNQLDSESRKDPTKALAGDSSMQSAQSRMTQIIQDAANTMDDAQIKRVADIGIVFNKTGTLEFDQKKFQSALDNKFLEVASLISGDSPLTGFANRISALVDGFVRTGDGVFTIREQGFNDQKKRLEKEKEQKTTRSEAKVERARMQLGKAEAAIAELNQISPAIAAGMPQKQ